MLDLQLQLHREYFLANVSGQRLFVALHLQPQEAARLRPPLAVAFVVDTSGSMRGRVTRPTGFRDLLFGNGANKLDLVVQAIEGILTSGLLNEADRLALVKFDSDARTLVPFTSAAQQAVLLGGAQKLHDFSGGTAMGAGMQAARKLLESERGHRRMLVLTDGQTTNENQVVAEATRLADLQIPVTTVGVGSDVNTELLNKVADLTQGQPMDVVPDAEQPQAPAVRASDLPAAVLGDLKNAANEVLSKVTLTVKTIRDVVLERVTRVQPTQTEVDLHRSPLLLGNLDADHGSTYVLEFTVPSRPASRMRLGQLQVGFQVTGLADGQTQTLPPQDLIVEFVTDEALAAQLNPDVMRWVQQRNVEGLIVQATKLISTDPKQAQQSLQLARQMTERLGNANMTRVLDQAMGELQQSKTISVATAKTLQIGAKTQTLRAQDTALPSEDEIRRVTGA